MRSLMHGPRPLPLYARPLSMNGRTLEAVFVVWVRKIREAFFAFLHEPCPLLRRSPLTMNDMNVKGDFYALR